MRLINAFLLVLVSMMTLARSNPQKRAYRAQEAVHKERLRLVDEYKKCLQKPGDNRSKTEACGQYLRAAEALK